MKKYFTVIIALLVVVGIPLLYLQPARAASFDANHLIDNGIFENYNTMDANAIDSWLNSSFPSSCISSKNGFLTPDPQGWSASQNKYLFGGNVTAGQAIHDAAVLYHVNPQVILSTLEKEQSIPTGGAGCYQSPNPSAPFASSPAPNNTFTCTINGRSQTCSYACTYSGGCMNIALGYGCPYYCATADEGFSMQLTLGTWLLRFGEERSQGILTGYVGYESGDEYLNYAGPMTAGTWQRSASSPAVYYDGSYSTTDGSSVTITTGATATLYNFTPYVSGNQKFFNIFTGWFGTTTLGCGDSEPKMPQVVSMYNPVNHDHFYTNYACEASVLGYEYGYTYEGAVFNTTSIEPDGVPVWRLYNASTQLHLWTISQADIDAAKKVGYVQEGIAFYVAPQNAPNVNTVYRLYNPTSYQHLWSLVPGNSTTQQAGYQLEGPAFFTQ